MKISYADLTELLSEIMAVPRKVVIIKFYQVHWNSGVWWLWLIAESTLLKERAVSSEPAILLTIKYDFQSLMVIDFETLITRK